MFDLRDMTLVFEDGVINFYDKTNSIVAMCEFFDEENIGHIEYVIGYVN